MNTPGNKAAKKLRWSYGAGLTIVPGIKLTRYVHCTKLGHDGCVNTEGSEHADAGWHHWCPACNFLHAIAVEHPFDNGARWTFDGNMEKPTFHPSVKVLWTPEHGSNGVCHYNLEQGILKYHNDCTHKLKNQHVPLPNIPEREL